MDTFRKVYAPLTDGQKAEMLAVKEKAEELEALLIKASGRNPRLIAMAKSELEVTILLAVKAITTEEAGATAVQTKPE